jgi:RNA polymerase sigma-70 factor (ECF subfamily)
VDDRLKFEQIYRAHVGAVAAYARRRTDAATADDVVAETFLVCWRRLDRVPAEPLPWLYRVAANTLANRVRAERRQDATGRRIAVAPASHGAEPAELAEQSARAREVLAAMGRLPERDREALRLDGWEQLSARDAARVAGCSVPAFRVRLHRARRRLAALLDEAPPLQLRPVKERR